jgi:ankyrin repeat protein
MMAAREGHLSMVLLLMEHGADLDVRNEDGATALKLARERGKREVADMLARAGAKE